MMDTQETNLPEEEKIIVEATGELQESQAPENSPEETITETEVKVGKPEAKVEEAVVESEDTVVEAEEAETEADDAEAATAESDVETSEAETVAETAGTDVNAAAAEATVDDFETTVDENAVNEDKELPHPAPENQEDNTVTSTDTAPLSVMTAPEIIERLKQIIVEPQKHAYNEADMLKQTYYRLRRVEVEAKKKEFLEEGGDEKDFVPPEDTEEAELKVLISAYKDRRASFMAEEERRKEANYVLKQHLIERLKVLTESQDDFNKRYNEFREIQRKWKEIRLVPQEHVKELWRSYQLYNERFYDIVRINNQFREYDFKKNLELKTALCETVERLANERDIISAFFQLQKLHQHWREIGPVAREFRDSIWERFKEASDVINRRHQEHFESLKIAEEKNLGEKTAICEKIEKIDFKALKTIRDWDKMTKEVVAIQKRFRAVGFITRRQNVKIFERFRAACDNYFNKKSEFYKSAREELDKNLEIRKALIEKAEAMKHSTDWKETTNAFIELQNEWKKTGLVAHKHLSSTWKQFISACDYFFEQKNKENSSQKSGENVNMEAKKALIQKIETIDENLSDEDALTLLRDYISEWNGIGFVPFKDKDQLYKSFREATDRQFDRLNIHERDRRLQQFRSNLTDFAGAGKNKLYNERDRLMRSYEKVKSELQTYENNIGFFNVSSKGGGGLLKEMDRKIARLKEDMEFIIKKIEAIDENLE
jgi:hypothetical protein